MLLICPSCSTHYEVTAASIPAGGRSVKCAACGHTWMAEPQSANSTRLNPSFDRGPQIENQPTDRQATYFSRPRSTPRGGTALAALFDDPLPETDESLIEGKYAAVDQKDLSASVEQRLHDALSSGQIARLMGQQNKNQIPFSPFREELSALQDDPAEFRLPVVQVTKAETVSEKVRGQSGATLIEHENARPGIYGLSALLQNLSKGLVSGFMAVGDWLDDVILTRLFSSTADSEQVMTPGDEKVSEWRQRERRKAQNKMTPIRFLGWLSWAGALVGVVYGAVVYRSEVVKVWPEANAAYDFIGVGSHEPVILKNISYRYALSDKGPVIELHGALSHTGDRPVVTPLVQADALDVAGNVLTSWTFQINGPRQLLPEMETPFMCRALAPEGVTRLELSIVSSEARELIDLARTEEITIPATDEAGQQVFFMQKTTLGWNANQDDQPPPQK